MSIAKLFSRDGSQAVCLPNDLRFEGTDVHIRRVGCEVVLSALPLAVLHAMLDALNSFEPGVYLRREHPAEQERIAIRPRR